MTAQHDGTCRADFATSLAEKAQIVNATLEEMIAKRPEIRNTIREAMLYALRTPGKRIRGGLVLWCCEVICGRIHPEAKIAAAVVEMVHTYSLVHDDLPAMDNDDMRRGQPSCHRAFDEATAILAGDGLLTLAFEILAQEIDDPVAAVKLIRTLAEAAGPAGMIAGQMTDLESENLAGSLTVLQQIHVNKTAEMFAAAAAMGGICAGADDEQIGSLVEYGLKVGLCFQIADDILDVSGTSEHLGKTAGKDVKQGKITYPGVVGIEESRRIEKQLTAEAVGAIEPVGERGEVLRQLAAVLLERTR